MAVLIVCALAGVLGGGGPLSSVTSAAADGRVQVKYERFARVLASTRLEITIAQPAGGRPAHVRISESHLGAMSVRSITPEPESITLTDRAYLFVFERLPGAEAKIRLQLEPQTTGFVRGWAIVDNSAPLPIQQFIFP